MTIKQAIQEDRVSMRWVRTAATTITATLGAGAGLWAMALYLVEPRAVAWTSEVVASVTSNLQQRMVENQKTMVTLAASVESLQISVDALAEDRRQINMPSWVWDAASTSISDGPLGGSVVVSAAGYKMRDCGAPTVDLIFINGGGIFHRFQEVSLLSVDGRGIPVPPRPNVLQTVVYSAKIPVLEGVQAGRASGRISITYPARCPALAPALIENLQFRILPEQ